jgi:hypothetical protein
MIGASHVAVLRAHRSRRPAAAFNIQFISALVDEALLLRSAGIGVAMAYRSHQSQEDRRQRRRIDDRTIEPAS